MSRVSLAGPSLNRSQHQYQIPKLPQCRPADRSHGVLSELAKEQSAQGRRPSSEVSVSPTPGISKAELAGGCQSPDRKTRDREEKKQSRMRQ